MGVYAIYICRHFINFLLFMFCNKCIDIKKPKTKISCKCLALLVVTNYMRIANF